MDGITWFMNNAEQIKNYVHYAEGLCNELTKIPKKIIIVSILFLYMYCRKGTMNTRFVIMYYAIFKDNGDLIDDLKRFLDTTTGDSV